MTRQRSTLRRRLRAVLAAALVMTGAAWTSVNVPMEVQVPLFLRVLSYDRALSRAGGSDVVIGVLYDAASPVSAQDRTAFVRAVRGGSVQTVNNRRIRVVEVNVAAGQVARTLQSQQAVAAYVTAGLENRVGALVQAAGESNVMLLAGSEGLVRQGVAVGVDLEGGRPRLFINLAQVRAGGADLPTSVLQVATVIR